MTDSYSKIQQTALTLWKTDQQAFSKSERTAKQLGAALNKVKDTMPHGTYTPWLTKSGIERNRATYCMRLATGKVEKAKAKQKAKPKVTMLKGGMLVSWLGATFEILSGISSPDTLVLQVRLTRNPTTEPQPTPAPSMGDLTDASMGPDADEIAEAEARHEAGKLHPFFAYLGADKPMEDALREYLKDGPRRAHTYRCRYGDTLLAMDGTPNAPLRNALKNLGIVTLRTGKRGGEMWHLPSQVPGQQAMTASAGK
jgi:hypothetical protein